MKISRTVMRAFKMLEYIADKPEGASLTDIVKEMNIPSSSALDIIQTLYTLDCIYCKDESVKNYVIGPKLYALGSQYTKNSILLEMAKPYIAEVAERYNHVVVIAKRVGTHLVYIYRSPQGETIINLPEVGSYQELHTTALGKVLLGYSRKRDELFTTMELEPKSTASITDKTLLLQQLETITQRQVAFSNKEFHPHVQDVAVPLFNFENRLVGSMGIFFLSIEEISDQVVRALQESAKAISAKLGFKGDYYEGIG